MSPCQGGGSGCKLVLCRFDSYRRLLGVVMKQRLFQAVAVSVLAFVSLKAAHFTGNQIFQAPWYVTALLMILYLVVALGFFFYCTRKRQD